MEAHEPPASYAEYCRLPEDAPRYEILEGVGYVTPSPGGRHQRVSANLLYLFCHYLKLNPDGLIFDAPFDVILSEGDVVQPDLLFVANERLEIVRERGIFGAPETQAEPKFSDEEYNHYYEHKQEALDHLVRLRVGEPGVGLRIRRQRL